MKIVFISTFLPSKDGVGKYTDRLVKDLNALNVESHVITFQNNGDTKNKNVHRVLSCTFNGVKRTWQALNSIGADIIHVQFAIPVFRLYSFILWPLLWFYKRYHSTPIFVTLHEPKREITYFGILGRWFYSAICKICAEINVLTAASRDLIVEKCKVPSSKIQIVSHGLYLFENKDDHSKEIREKLGISNQQKIILFFGYIHIDKGIEYLVEAFSKFIQDSEDEQYVLLLAGYVRPRVGIFKIFQKIDERYERKIKKLIIDNGLSDRVIFFGYVEEKDVYSIFKLGEAVVLPYLKTEQSGVLNIALACDLPIIASDSGGFHDTLSESGILVEPRNSKAIANALKDVLCEKSGLTKINLLQKYREFKNSNNSHVIAEKQLAHYKNFTV